MREKAFPDIPRSVLAGLLDLAGEPNSISPRLLLGVAKDLRKRHLAELYAGDFTSLPGGSRIRLSPVFTRVSEVLLKPRINITVRIWGNDRMCGETNILFPGDLQSGGGVILNQVGTYFRISAFIDSRDIIDLLSPVLPDNSETQSSFDFEAHLDISAAAVLFGLVDLANEAEGTKSSGVKSAVISGYVHGRWGMTGFDRLLSYVTVAGISPEPPSLTEIELSLDRLTAGDWLTRKDEIGYSLSPDLFPLTGLAKNLRAGLQWERVSLVESGELLTCSRIFLLGKGSTVLCFSPGSKGTIFAVTRSAVEVIDFFADEFAYSLPVLIPGEYDAVPVSVQPLCSGCGSPIKKEQRFCAHCGKQIEGEDQAEEGTHTRICPGCQAQVERGQAVHCPECGTELQYSKKEKNDCLRCGKPMRKEAAFCPHCGMKSPPKEEAEPKA